MAHLLCLLEYLNMYIEYSADVKYIGEAATYSVPAYKAPVYEVFPTIFKISAKVLHVLNGKSWLLQL
jgi:hypothetical protein